MPLVKQRFVDLVGRMGKRGEGEGEFSHPHPLNRQPRGHLRTTTLTGLYSYPRRVLPTNVKLRTSIGIPA